MEVHRVKTGIPGLDGKIEGGFFFPSMVLVMGPPGTGKTTFSLQYLFEGTKHREKGILFSTLSENSSSLIQFASHFWFIDSKSFGSKLFMVDLSQKLKTCENRDQFLSEIDEKVRKFNAKRIVIDPINLIQLSLPDLKEYRLFMFELSKYIKERRIQALVTAELYDNNYHCHECVQTSIHKLAVSSGVFWGFLLRCCARSVWRYHPFCKSFWAFWGFIPQSFQFLLSKIAIS